MTLEQLCILANAGFTKDDINTIISQTVPPQTVPPQTVPPQTAQPQTVQSQALDVLQYLNRSLDRFEVPPERTASQVLEERYIEQTSGQTYADWLKSMKGDVK